MKNHKNSLVKEIKELKQRDRIHQDEMANLKRVYNAKQQLLESKVQALNAEIDRLKELCGEDIGMLFKLVVQYPMILEEKFSFRVYQK